MLAAQERNRFHPEYAPGCPDCLSGLFLLEGGVQMTVSVDLLRPDGQTSWGDDWIRIVGSEGSLEANPALGTIRLIRKGQVFTWEGSSGWKDLWDLDGTITK